MDDLHLLVLLIALVADWLLGEPNILWSRIPHPVVLFGKAVEMLDRLLNIETDPDAVRFRKGAVTITALILVALLAGLALDVLFEAIGFFGFFLEVFVVFTLLAQRSLHDHVKAVVHGLRNGGLEGGRKAVGMIVGRDTAFLDVSGTCRAAIESLAENFSDGVVAPAIWYAVFGLPGLLVYKMINTADSMIGYKSDRYFWFGKASARVDDLANWLPARLSAALIALASGLLHGSRRGIESMKSALRNAGLHNSPNAGWPEAAMASGAGIALGGSRIYSHGRVEQAWINPSGKRLLAGGDVDTALALFATSCFLSWGGVVLWLCIALLV
jgi:adenosylcobinamide-phosphate synthase